MDFEWLETVERLKQAAVEFTQRFTRLLALEQVARADPAAAVRYDNLMGIAGSLRDRISYLTGLIDRAFEWFNANGSPPPQTVQGLGNLGFLWVPVAVIAAAIAAIVAWNTDADTEIAKLEAAKDLIDKGVSPNEAWRLVREQQPGLIGSIFQGLQNNFLLFTALGLAAWYLPKFLDKGRR